jgi:hypothetical protein
MRRASLEQGHLNICSYRKGQDEDGDEDKDDIFVTPAPKGSSGERINHVHYIRKSFKVSGL